MSFSSPTWRAGRMCGVSEPSLPPGAFPRNPAISTFLCSRPPRALLFRGHILLGRAVHRVMVTTDILVRINFSGPFRVASGGEQEV